MRGIATWTTIATLLCLAASGCGSATTQGDVPPPPSPQQPPLPPRPRALPLNGIEPCGLLAGPGAARLRVGPGSPNGTTVNGNTAKQCQWSTHTAWPRDSWVARILLQQDAAAALRSPHDNPIVQVDGFSAVQASAAGTNPQRECVLYIDVAPGQSLLVEYVNGLADDPTTTHATACDKARAAATSMVQTLATLVRE